MRTANQAAGDAGGRTRRLARRPEAEDGRREYPQAAGPAAGIAVFLVFLLLVSSAGCGPKWREKFIRKSTKSKTTAQPVLVLLPDQKALLPAADRYREHFAFWKFWHGGLIDSLGEVRKRDAAQLSGAIGELQAMQGILTGKPADDLREILVELQEIQNRLSTAPPTWNIPAPTRTRLQQLYREIDKKYHYSNVKDALPQEPPAAPK